MIQGLEYKTTIIQEINGSIILVINENLQNAVTYMITKSFMFLYVRIKFEN